MQKVPSIEETSAYAAQPSEEPLHKTRERADASHNRLHLSMEAIENVGDTTEWNDAATQHRSIASFIEEYRRNRLSRNFTAKPRKEGVSEIGDFHLNNLAAELQCLSTEPPFSQRCDKQGPKEIRYSDDTDSSQINGLPDRQREKQRLLDMYITENLLLKEQIVKLEKLLEDRNAVICKFKSMQIREAIGSGKEKSITRRSSSVRDEFMNELKSYNERTQKNTTRSPIMQIVKKIAADVNLEAKPINQSDTSIVLDGCKHMGSVAAEFSSKLRAFSRNARANISPIKEPDQLAIERYQEEYSHQTPIVQTSPELPFDSKESTSYVFFVSQHLVNVLSDGEILLDGIREMEIAGIKAIAYRVNKFSVLIDGLILSFNSVCRVQEKVKLPFDCAISLDYTPSGYVIVTQGSVFVYTLADGSFSRCDLRFQASGVSYLRDGSYGRLLVFGRDALALIDIQSMEVIALRRLNGTLPLRAIQVKNTAFLMFDTCIWQIDISGLNILETLGFKNHLIASSARSGTLYAALHTGEIAIFQDGDLLLERRMLVAQSCAACAFGIERIHLIDAEGHDKSLKWNDFE